MTFCSKCGNEEPSEKTFCSQCGTGLVENRLGPTSIQKRRSNWWYLLAILFTPIGGIIAYFVIKNDDPSKAKNCLWIGMILFAIGFIVGAVSG